MSNAKRDSMMRSSVWAMESLVGSESLQLGIPDTILFKDGASQAWLFTSKAGDVLKKRSLRKSSIKERFMRLFAANPNNLQNRVATVRFMDGTVRNLGRDAFKEMMSKFPATEPGIVAIQCYVQGKGTAGTIYRNSYRVVNDKGLVVTGTTSFTTLASEQAASPSCVWSEREIKPEKCHASSVNAALDAVTSSVVRFLETQQDTPTRILNVVCDFIVDNAGQIWLTWIGESTIAVAGAARDLRLANVPLEGPRGRGDFLGPQTALAMQREFGGPPSPVRRTKRLGRPRARMSDNADNVCGNGKNNIGEAVARAAELIELPRGVVDVPGYGGGGGIADALSRAGVAKAKQNSESWASNLSRTAAVSPSPFSPVTNVCEQGTGSVAGAVTTLSTMTVGIRAGAAWGGNGAESAMPTEAKRYPSSFACAGDYCSIRVLDPREDADDPRKQRALNDYSRDPERSDQDFFTEVERVVDSRVEMLAGITKRAVLSNSSNALPGTRVLELQKLRAQESYPINPWLAEDLTTVVLHGQVASRLFSGQELFVLRRDASFRRQIKEGLVMEVEPFANTTDGGAKHGNSPIAPGSTTIEEESCRRGGAGVKGDPVAGGLRDRNPRDWSEVSWKSISLARRESDQRGHQHHQEGGALVSQAPGAASLQINSSNSARDRGSDRADDGVDVSGGGRAGTDKSKGARDRAQQETEASAMRQHARKREDDFVAGGSQNFYKPVRVCGSCFRVYALLDIARTVLARHKALAVGEAEARERSSFLEPSKSSTRSRRRYLRAGRRASGNGNSRSYASRSTCAIPENGDEWISLSSDEIQGRRGHDVAGSGAVGRMVGEIPPRPCSQGDSVGRVQRRRKRPLPSGNGDGQSRDDSGEYGVEGEGEANTWRGRLGNGRMRSGCEKGSALSSGKKFEDLDDYLRGCAATAVAKREKRRKKRGFGFGRKGALRDASDCSSSLAEGSSSLETAGGSLSVITGGCEEEDEREDGAGLFHARILLAEPDRSTANRIKDILESAGYMVTVEGDGKQAVEALIEGDGEWDALLMERDMPVLDGFGITSALRDFERARRNRASTVRAATVEEHGKVTASTRGHGLERDIGAPSSVPPASEIRHLPIICLTSKANPEDLRSYMAAGMDGCVSKPPEAGPLLNTLRAAVPLHLSLALPAEGPPVAGPSGGAGGAGGGMKSTQGKGLGVLKGSAACAAQGMVLPIRRAGDTSVEGALQVDADTSVPYCVIGTSAAPSGTLSGRFFNLVVCHDLFDNFERMKIVVAPVIARYPGAQVLLWNYPGQAFSEWREQQLLNNEYLATILQYLLLHLGSKSKGGTDEFDSDRPYHLVGFGSGGAVATFYASHFASPSPRSLLLINSFSYVDAYLAGVLHDCMNVFSCAPASRPDLPVYFHARFLFSPAYLGQVSTPLALNIYTAVYNPISVKGRLQLCKGALAHVDTRPVLSEIDVPVICIQSTQNNFVKPLHTDPYVSRRGGEVRSIHKALHDPTKTCVVWINAGHEVFQEARAQTTTLLEQAIAGYHEKNDVVYAMSHPEFVSAPGAGGGTGRNADCNSVGLGGTKPSKRGRGGLRKERDSGESVDGDRRGGDNGRGPFEDEYIDNVLRTMDDRQSDARYREEGVARRAAVVDGDRKTAVRRRRADADENDDDADNTEMGSAWDGCVGEVYGSSWENYRSDVAAAATNAAGRGGHSGKHGDGGGSVSSDEGRRRRGMSGPGGTNGRRKGGRRRGGGHGVSSGEGDGAQGRNIMVGTVLDASHPAFERQDNLVFGFGQGSKVYPQPDEFPEVKEYMTWRLKRNRRRLVRLDRAARRIQGALRAYLAMKTAQAMRETRACVYIQRVFRGWRGRLTFLDKLRSVWAAQVVQRNWRGHASRRWFQLLRRQQAACGHMQRVWRGALIRRQVRATRNRRDHAAALMQALWRGLSGRRHAFRCRTETHGAITVQRVFRGHTGRRRAGRERDKYLFSKSQSQGISFGRQMLLEHKLHATRLQSDVQLLTGEKVGAEEAVEAIMEEISEFEEAITVLEKEMHQLSKIETEAVGVLDEEARVELREQKVRLDKEFGEMLGKIADRKDRLLHMEKKLSTLDRTRLGKEEELRTLERKLVVLLEEQQRELESIRRRQEKKGTLLLTAAGGGRGGDGGPGGMIGGAGGSGGPSAKDKRQAAQLMQSTETLMKFGFMSMSMTYFSSLNMIRAMRSVGATDTVMSALAHNASDAAGRGGGGRSLGGGSGSDGGDDSRALALEQNEKLGAEPFRPSLKPGQLPGQEPLAVAAWSVDDVARWLQTLTLTQYQEAFIAAAVDGAFLYDLNDDDLKSSLGVEHRLHRKKILNSIHRLKAAEAERVGSVSLNTAMTSRNSTAPAFPEAFQNRGISPDLLGDAGEAMGRVMTADDPSGTMGGGPVAVPIHFKELVVLTRRGKYKQIREILEPLPERRFDTSTIRVQYVTDYGTAYVDAYEQEPFNLNKVDDHGNTLLMVAAQNGNLKMSKLFVNKGANPNHQNKAGHTAGHYAVSYQFFDLSEWLFLQDGSGAGADDTLENAAGLGPYDGLQADAGGG